jgi:seryl-tRNA synthetase
MLSIKVLLENIGGAAERLKAREPGFEPIHARIVELDESRRRLIREVEDLQARRNATSKEIGARKKTGQDASALLAESQELAARIKELDRELDRVKADLNSTIEVLPNIPIDPTPLAADKSGNIVVKEWGEPRRPDEWGFQFRNHIEVAENLGANGGLDFGRAAKMTGSNWPMYRGELARLEWALVMYLIDRSVADGRELIIPPYLVNSGSMFASGQFPKFREQAYECRDDDLVLLPTSEVALLNLYRDEIIPGDALPVRLASFTPCFRREAGTYGKGERGLIRIHQFHKVEMFSFVLPEDSRAELEEMTGFAESLVESLGLAYRTTLLAAGDLAQQAACTYDIEVWLPGQEAYSEASSVSNCTDYQARRAAIRYRPEGKGSPKPELVHSLNGSALATSRVMVAILENYQQADGSLTVPVVLRSYMSGQDRIEAKKSG